MKKYRYSAHDPAIIKVGDIVRIWKHPDEYVVIELLGPKKSGVARIKHEDGSITACPKVYLTIKDYTPQ